MAPSKGPGNCLRRQYEAIQLTTQKEIAAMIRMVVVFSSKRRIPITVVVPMVIVLFSVPRPKTD